MLLDFHKEKENPESRIPSPFVCNSGTKTNHLKKKYWQMIRGITHHGGDLFGAVSGTLVGATASSSAHRTSCTAPLAVLLCSALVKLGRSLKLAEVGVREEEKKEHWDLRADALEGVTATAGENASAIASQNRPAPRVWMNQL